MSGVSGTSGTFGSSGILNSGLPVVMGLPLTPMWNFGLSVVIGSPLTPMCPSGLSVVEGVPLWLILCFFVLSWFLRCCSNRCICE
ncbi:hypothetical protein [Lactobacillus sp. UMNPBX4]|uniref:hypothetical protein n=1 Tax=Lactobacillus sp. UMNPBX4 TaxID=2042043 RepID=UPI0018ECEB9A|nr:hypothetical protein [Lactobacillus sp. UMNPBX4]